MIETPVFFSPIYFVGAPVFFCPNTENYLGLRGWCPWNYLVWIGLKGLCKDKQGQHQYTVTGWGAKFDLQLVSQCGSMCNCSSRSLWDMLVAETLLSNQQQTQFYHGNVYMWQWNSFQFRFRCLSGCYLELIHLCNVRRAWLILSEFFLYMYSVALTYMQN